MLAEQLTYFPRDGHRTEVLGTNQIRRMTAIKRPYRGCIQFHDINKTPACTATFVKKNSFHSLDNCEDKWFNKLNAQINIHGMILPRVK